MKIHGTEQCLKMLQLTTPISLIECGYSWECGDVWVTEQGSERLMEQGWKPTYPVRINHTHTEHTGPTVHTIGNILHNNTNIQKHNLTC